MMNNDNRGDPLYVGNLPRFSSEESVMDLFGQSIAWDCPITNVRLQKQGREVQAIVWIIAGSRDDMNSETTTTVDQIIENMHHSEFQGKKIEVRMADPDETTSP